MQTLWGHAVLLEDTDIKPKAFHKLVEVAWENFADSVVNIVWYPKDKEDTQNTLKINFLEEQFDITSFIAWEEDEIWNRRIPLSLLSKNLIGKQIPVLKTSDVSIQKVRKVSWSNAKVLDEMKVWGFIEIIEVSNQDKQDKNNKYTFRYTYWDKQRIITLKHGHFEWILYQILGIKSRLFIDGWNLELRKILWKNKKK